MPQWQKLLRMREKLLQCGNIDPQASCLCGYCCQGEVKVGTPKW
jgi:hypothetical protein